VNGREGEGERGKERGRLSHGCGGWTPLYKVRTDGVVYSAAVSTKKKQKINE